MCEFCSTFAPAFGKMAEWSIASVLKTEVLKGTGGSNPSLSARRVNCEARRRPNPGNN